MTNQKKHTNTVIAKPTLIVLAREYIFCHLNFVPSDSVVIYVVTSLSRSIHGTGTNAYTVGGLFHGKCRVDICNTATNGS